MMITIISIIILIFSAVVHEVAHGWMAKRLGDETADREGRLTLNPLKHLDPIGSVILPLILVVTKANFFFAWAKPVPYNPYNLKDKKYGELKVAAAGPISNLLIALLFSIFIRITTSHPALQASFIQADISSLLSVSNGSLMVSLVVIAFMIVYINIFLAIFNLIPIPPLDGSKILYAFLPARGREFLMRIEQYSFIILLVLIMGGVFDFLALLVNVIFRVLVGG